jgi:hypothetical protein
MTALDRKHRRSLTLQICASTRQATVFSFDESGEDIPVNYSNVETLVQLADGGRRVRAMRHGGNLSAAMLEVADFLCALASPPAGGDEVPPEFVCYALQDACKEVLVNSRMHVLAGLSPDESALFVVFAPISMLAGIARAKC